MPLSLLLAAAIAIGLVVIQLIITGTGLVQFLQLVNVLVLLDAIRA